MRMDQPLAEYDRVLTSVKTLSKITDNKNKPAK
jgi:hypothetical protein